MHEGPSERYGPFKDVQVLWESGTKAGRRGGQNNIAEELGLSPSKRPCQQPAWNVCQVLGVLHVIVAQTLQRKGALRQYLPKFQMRTLKASVTKGPPRATSELAAAHLLPPCPGAIPACWTCPLSQCPSWGICHRVKMKFSFCVLIYETGRG